MKIGKNFLLILSILALVSISTTESSFSIRYVELLRNGTVESDSDVSCVCYYWNEKVLKPKEDILEDFENLRNSSFCQVNTDNRICKVINLCIDCNFEMETMASASSLNSTDYEIKRTFLFDDSYFEQSINIFHRNKHRYSHSKDACLSPTSMITADVLCYDFGRGKRCIQTCYFDYTFKEGISRELKCFYKENKWMPYQFEECHRIDGATIESPPIERLILGDDKVIIESFPVEPLYPGGDDATIEAHPVEPLISGINDDTNEAPPVEPFTEETLLNKTLGLIPKF